jgi:hypothetical protein
VFSPALERVLTENLGFNVGPVRDLVATAIISEAANKSIGGGFSNERPSTAPELHVKERGGKRPQSHLIIGVFALVMILIIGIAVSLNQQNAPRNSDERKSEGNPKLSSDHADVVEAAGKLDDVLRNSDFPGEEEHTLIKEALSVLRRLNQTETEINRVVKDGDLFYRVQHVAGQTDDWSEWQDFIKALEKLRNAQ